MAGTYGEPGKNTFAVPGVGGILSPVVNDTTGVTQVYRGTALGRFQSLGTYNPSTNKFTADSNAGLSSIEINALSSERGLKEIKDKGSLTVNKGVQAAGGSPESGQAASNKLFSPNTANNAAETGDFSQPSFLGSAIEGSAETRNSFPNLIYPEDIASTKQDVVKFTMLKYEPKSFSSTNLGGFSSRSQNRNGIGSVILPIPAGISDTNAVQWGAENMNAVEAAAGAIAIAGITKGVAPATEVVEEKFKSLVKGSDEVKAGVAGLYASAAVGTNPGQFLSRTQGAILNPNMELLFQGPSLRPFAFTFKMSARSESEAKQIIGIIRFFKQGMSAQKSASNLFLKAPHTFKIQYLHRPKGSSTDHPYIGKIKECALQNLTVNYTPEGQYATYNDGVLVSYEMQMTFQELEPVFNEDYGQGTGSSGPDTDLGY